MKNVLKKVCDLHQFSCSRKPTRARPGPKRTLCQSVLVVSAMLTLDIPVLAQPPYPAVSGPTAPPSPPSSLPPRGPLAPQALF
jgi:hypothetical protein